MRVVGVSIGTNVYTRKTRRSGSGEGWKARTAWRDAWRESKRRPPTLPPNLSGRGQVATSGCYVHPSKNTGGADNGVHWANERIVELCTGSGAGRIRSSMRGVRATGLRRRGLTSMPTCACLRGMPASIGRRVGILPDVVADLPSLLGDRVTRGLRT